MILANTLPNNIEPIRLNTRTSASDVRTPEAESFDRTLSRYESSNDTAPRDDSLTEPAVAQRTTEPVEREVDEVDRQQTSDSSTPDETPREPDAAPDPVSEAELPGGGDKLVVETQATGVEAFADVLPATGEAQPTTSSANVGSSIAGTENTSKDLNLIANSQATSAANASLEVAQAVQVDATQISAAQAEVVTQVQPTRTNKATQTPVSETFGAPEISVPGSLSSGAPVLPIPEQSLDQGQQQQTTPDRPQILTAPVSSNELTITSPVVNAAPPTSEAPAPALVTPTLVTPTNAAEATALARSSSEGDDSVNATRIGRGLQNAVTQRGGTITLRLTPADMGTVRIQMQITGTTVSAQFYAETQQGHTLLSQQLTQLRQTLEGQGLQVDRLGVQAMQTSQSSSNQAQQQNDSSQQQSRTDDGRSRGSFDQQQGRSRDERSSESTEQPFNFEHLLQDESER